MKSPCRNLAEGPTIQNFASSRNLTSSEFQLIRKRQTTNGFIENDYKLSIYRMIYIYIYIYIYMAHMAYMACICLYHVTPPDGLTPWDPWMSPWKRPTLGEVRRRGWEGDRVFVIHMTSIGNMWGYVGIGISGKAPTFPICSILFPVSLWFHGKKCLRT